MSVDLTGRELTAAEQQLLHVYERLRALAADTTLAPCVVANVRHALAAVAQPVNDLGLVFEHLLDVGV
jgi:hypothetical protein